VTEQLRRKQAPHGGKKTKYCTEVGRVGGGLLGLQGFSDCGSLAEAQDMWEGVQESLRVSVTVDIRVSESLRWQGSSGDRRSTRPTP
jgi:hypothetical protein